MMVSMVVVMLLAALPLALESALAVLETFLAAVAATTMLAVVSLTVPGVAWPGVTRIHGKLELLSRTARAHGLALENASETR